MGSGQEGVDQPPPPGHSAQSAAVWFGGSTIGPPDSKSGFRLERPDPVPRKNGDGESTHILKLL